MAKKIKFPLEVANGVKARNIEELRENFDIELIITYYKNGKLITWLEDRYYEAEVEEINKLKISDDDFIKRLCKIFEVEYVEEVDSEEILRKAERVMKLKSFTGELEIINNVEKVAFDQEELADLLDEEEKKIYLCGEKFSIPLRREGIEYIGVNTPTVVIRSKEIVDFEEKKISFINIKFNNEYEALIDLEKLKNKKKTNNEYKSSDLLGYKLSKEEIEKSKNIFNSIYEELASSKIDLDKKSSNIQKQISQLRNNREEFLQRFK